MNPAVTAGINPYQGTTLVVPTVTAFSGRLLPGLPSYQGTTLVVPTVTSGTKGFSPCLLSRQIREAIREFVTFRRQPLFHWVLGDVVPTPRKTLLVHDSHFREAALPHFPPDKKKIPVFFLQTIGEATPDRVNVTSCMAFSYRHVSPYGQQYVQVVRHDHEIVDLELPGRHIGTQYVHQEHGVALRLQQSRTLDRFCGGEKRARRSHNRIGARIASRFRHSQGLKAQPLHSAVRHDLKSCPDTSSR
jgi:hypothetical protein